MKKKKKERKRPPTGQYLRSVTGPGTRREETKGEKAKDYNCWRRKKRWKTLQSLRPDWEGSKKTTLELQQNQMRLSQKREKENENCLRER